MSLTDYKKGLRDRLANGELGQVIERLRADVTSTDAQNTLVIRGSEWVKLNKAKDNNVISTEEYGLETNRITVAVQNVLDQLKEADIVLPNSPLQMAIEALNLEPKLPKVALVNINRNNPFEAFQSSFEAMMALPYQFYFVVGSPDQQPNHFAERAVYEIIGQVLANNEKAIHYKREPFKIGEQIIERVCVDPLPFSGFGLEACKNLFKVNLQERVAHLSLEFDSVEAFAALPEARLPYQFFTLVYGIDADAWGTPWHRNISAYLRWIVDTFRNNHSTSPVFQFIFVVNKKDIHDKPDPLFDQELNALIASFGAPNPCARIDGLKEINEGHIKDWLTGLSKQRMQFQVEKIIEEYRKKCVAEGRWEGEKEMDMADVEELVLEVHRISNK
jgi:Effector-associated domain 11